MRTYLGADNSSEEGSEVNPEGVGLHWVAGLRLLPMYCGSEGTREGEVEGSRGPSREEDSCFYDLDHIVETLEVSGHHMHVEWVP